MTGARPTAHEGLPIAAASARPQHPVEAPAIDLAAPLQAASGELVPLAASAALHRSVLALQRQAGNQAVSRMIGGQKIQRVKLKLEPGRDTPLMERLRQVSPPNSGAQTLDDPKAVNTLQTIGVDENIILEGHGTRDKFDTFARDLGGRFGIPWDAPVLQQGGLSPNKLARLAHDVPKPDDWRGNIILHGCSTGDITSEVSKEYFELAKKPVTVMGTLLNIRVGMTGDGHSFIGSDWTDYPEAERSADLAFVTALQEANDEFYAAVGALFSIVRKGNEFISKVIASRQSFFAKVINDAQTGRQPSGTLPDFHEATPDVTLLVQKARRIISIDDDTRYTGMRLSGRDYFFDTRNRMHELFEGVVAKLQASTIWKPNEFYAPGFPRIDSADMKGKVQALTNVATTEYSVLVTAADSMRADESKLHGELTYKLVGLTLKRIDITDPAQAKHSRMEKQKGTFRDKWVDRAAPQQAAQTSATPRLEQAFNV